MACSFDAASFVSSLFSIEIDLLPAWPRGRNLEVGIPIESSESLSAGGGVGVRGRCCFGALCRVGGAEVSQGRGLRARCVAVCSASYQEHLLAQLLAQRLAGPHGVGTGVVGGCQDASAWHNVHPRHGQLKGAVQVGFVH